MDEHGDKLCDHHFCDERSFLWDESCKAPGLAYPLASASGRAQYEYGQQGSGAAGCEHVAGVRRNTASPVVARSPRAARAHGRLQEPEPVRSPELGRHVVSRREDQGHRG
eukprot:scaffold115974_cov63-Phaeocystis_antarctica.AAC.6